MKEDKDVEKNVEGSAMTEGNNIIQDSKNINDREQLDEKQFLKEMNEIIKRQRDWYMKNKDKVINLDGNDDFTFFDE
jgi:DNA polymerase II large subunit